MPEAEYLPVPTHFNPAHPDYESWARKTPVPQVADAPAAEDVDLPDEEHKTDETA